MGPFSIVSVEVNPNQCRLMEELKILMDFESEEEIELSAKISLVLDIVHVCSDCIPRLIFLDQTGNSRERHRDSH